MLEPQRLTTLWASTACYRDSLTFYTRDVTLLFRLLRLGWQLTPASRCALSEEDYESTSRRRGNSQAPPRRMGRGGRASSIINVCTRFLSVVRLIQFSYRGSVSCTEDGWTSELVSALRKSEKSSFQSGTEHRFTGHSAHSLFTVLT
jgi:hypothetical protein